MHAATTVHPIQLKLPGGTKGVDHNNLVPFLLDLCEQHQREGRALAFAFVFYNRRHAQVARVLEERHFYGALDEISGRWLTVFFVDSRPPASRLGAHDFDAELSHEALGSIQKTFGVAWDSSKPAILFFQVDPGRRVCKGRLVSFRDQGYDETFEAMRHLLEIASESIERVEPQNSSNHDEIFGLIENALQSDAFIRGGRFLYKAITTVKGLLF